LLFVQYQEMVFLLVLFLTHIISLLVLFVSPLQSALTPIRSLQLPSAVFSTPGVVKSIGADDMPSTHGSLAGGANSVCYQVVWI